MHYYQLLSKESMSLLMYILCSLATSPYFFRFSPDPIRQACRQNNAPYPPTNVSPHFFCVLPVETSVVFSNRKWLRGSRFFFISDGVSPISSVGRYSFLSRVRSCPKQKGTDVSHIFVLYIYFFPSFGVNFRNLLFYCL